VHIEKTREKQQKRKKDDHLSASYLWLTRAQNFDHGSYMYVTAVEISRSPSAEPAVGSRVPRRARAVQVAVTRH